MTGKSLILMCFSMLLLFPGSHVVVGLLGTSAECRAAEFRTKPGFRAVGISNDGSTVLWNIGRSSGLVESRGGDTWDIPDGSVQGIDGSGGLVVGNFQDDNQIWQAALWTQNGDVQLLGQLAGEAWDISSDGQTVVGAYGSGFLWTEANGTRALPATRGFEASHAFGVSADGRVAVGSNHTFVDRKLIGAEATMWVIHEDGEIETIGLGQPNGEDTGAVDVSDDGSVVTGIVGKRHGGWLTAYRDDPEKTFRWTEKGMVTLDLLSGTVSSTPTGISGDGAFLVGNAETESGRMFVWDGQHGTRDLETVLIEEHGLDSDIFPVADGEIRWVEALSSDGTALAGSFGATIETKGPHTGWVAYLDRPLNTSLIAGDADQDLDFDQLDLVRVQQAGKYLSGQAATWGDGDWNGAPRIRGDGVFDQNDIVAALQANVYLTGPYGAIKTNGSQGDGQTSLTYDAHTGELVVDAPVGNELTSINITSASGMFLGGKPTALDGAFDDFTTDNIFKATFGGSFDSISFGNVAPRGLSENFLLGDLSIVGSLDGGGALGEVDLIYVPVPEPASAILLLVGVLMSAIAGTGRYRHAVFPFPR